MWLIMILAPQVGLSTRIMLQDETLAMARASIVARERMLMLLL